MPPETGDDVPEFEALLCTGGSFRSTSLSDALDNGDGVVIFFGFAFSAIAENWWKRYDKTGWEEFDRPVLGVSRDGPYAQNAFIRYLDSPFEMFSDTDGAASEAFDLLTEREHMANTTTPMRSVFVIDDGKIAHRWIGEDWISPVPREDIEDVIERL